MNRFAIPAFFILVAAYFLAGAAVAEKDEPTPRILRFEPAVIGIDTIRHDAGPVTIRFEYTNISDKEVSIIDVHSQCGCTKAEFSREPVRPGAKGHIYVTLDPKNLFAEQNRHLTVIATNGEYRKFNTITIQGYVERDVTEEEVLYPYELAPGLRSKVNAVGMRLSENGGEPIREFTVYNAGDDTLRLGWASGSRRVRASVPTVLGPRTSAEIKVSVNTAGMPSGNYEEYLYLFADRKKVRIPLKGAVK